MPSPKSYSLAARYSPCRSERPASAPKAPRPATGPFPSARPDAAIALMSVRNPRRFCDKQLGIVIAPVMETRLVYLTTTGVLQRYQQMRLVRAARQSPPRRCLHQRDYVGAGRVLLRILAAHAASEVIGTAHSIGGPCDARVTRLRHTPSARGRWLGER